MNYTILGYLLGVLSGFVLWWIVDNMGDEGAIPGIGFNPELEY